MTKTQGNNIMENLIKFLKEQNVEYTLMGSNCLFELQIEVRFGFDIIEFRKLIDQSHNYMVNTRYGNKNGFDAQITFKKYDDEKMLIKRAAAFIKKSQRKQHHD